MSGLVRKRRPAATATIHGEDKGEKETDREKRTNRERQGQRTGLIEGDRDRKEQAEEDRERERTNIVRQGQRGTDGGRQREREKDL